MKRYKAVLHFNKVGASKGTPWTVHYRGTCYLVREIRCSVPMQSEWKPEKKSNPRAFFTVVAESLTIEDGLAILQ